MEYSGNRTSPLSDYDLEELEVALSEANRLDNSTVSGNQIYGLEYQENPPELYDTFNNIDDVLRESRELDSVDRISTGDYCLNIEELEKEIEELDRTGYQTMDFGYTSQSITDPGILNKSETNNNSGSKYPETRDQIKNSTVSVSSPRVDANSQGTESEHNTLKFNRSTSTIENGTIDSLAAQPLPNEPLESRGIPSYTNDFNSLGLMKHETIADFDYNQSHGFHHSLKLRDSTRSAEDSDIVERNKRLTQRLLDAQNDLSSLESRLRKEFEIELLKLKQDMLAKKETALLDLRNQFKLELERSKKSLITFEMGVQVESPLVGDPAVISLMEPFTKTKNPSKEHLIETIQLVVDHVTSLSDKLKHNERELDAKIADLTACKHSIETLTKSKESLAEDRQRLLVDNQNLNDIILRTNLEHEKSNNQSTELYELIKKENQSLSGKLQDLHQIVTEKDSRIKYLEKSLEDATRKCNSISEEMQSEISKRDNESSELRKQLEVLRKSVNGTNSTLNLRNSTDSEHAYNHSSLADILKISTSAVPNSPPQSVKDLVNQYPVLTSQLHQMLQQHYNDRLEKHRQKFENQMNDYNTKLSTTTLRLKNECKEAYENALDQLISSFKEKEELMISRVQERYQDRLEMTKATVESLKAKLIAKEVIVGFSLGIYNKFESPNRNCKEKVCRNTPKNARRGAQFQN
jgi:hypothetical protein